MSQALPNTKRLRDADSEEEGDQTIQRGVKRFKCLPIRSPPNPRPNNFFSRACSLTPQSVPALLTPVESSDDDVASNDLNFEPSPLPHLDDSHTSSDSSTSSIKVVVGDDGDMEMADSQPREFSSPQPWQRQRSNDMLAPPNLPLFLDTQHRQINERQPTPIWGYFTDSDVNMDVHWTGPRPSTSLSPFIREEEEISWSRGHRPPSPADTFDGVMTPISQADGTLGGLNVDDAGRHDVSQNDTPFPPLLDQGHSVLEGQGEASGGELDAPRSRRLTMGFRADCSKCIQRVPGHYSHIVYD